MNMTARWPAPKGTAPEFVRKSVIHPIICNPIRSLLVIFGIVVLVAAAQAQAYSPVTVALTPSEVWLQPGTEISGKLSVVFPMQWTTNAHVWFDIQSPSGITIDGQLNAFDSPLSATKNIIIRSSSFAEEGTYTAFITVHTILDNSDNVNVLPVTIHVGPKNHFIYETTNFSTLAPTIGNIDVSPSQMVLHRTETGSFTVSFTNYGSTTDYLIRLAEPVISLNVDVQNATHRFVEHNETVTAFVEVTATKNAPFDTIPLRIEAYDLASGQKTFLGSVLVDVQETTNIVPTLPSQSFVVEDGNVTLTGLTLQNTEWNDTQATLVTSSNSIVLSTTMITIPAKGVVTIPLTIQGDLSAPLRNETIYVLTGDFTAAVPFIVKTIPSTHSNSENDSDDDGLSSSTGLLSGATSTVLGLIILIFALLMIVSKNFRERIKSYLPKSEVPPVVKKE